MKSVQPHVDVFAPCPFGLSPRWTGRHSCLCAPLRVRRCARKGARGEGGGLAASRAPSRCARRPDGADVPSLRTRCSIRECRGERVDWLASYPARDHIARPKNASSLKNGADVNLENATGLRWNRRALSGYPGMHARGSATLKAEEKKESPWKGVRTAGSPAANGFQSLDPLQLRENGSSARLLWPPGGLFSTALIPLVLLSAGKRATRLELLECATQTEDERAQETRAQPVDGLWERSRNPCQSQHVRLATLVYDIPPPLTHSTSSGEP